MKFRTLSTICLSGLLLVSLATGVSGANNLISTAKIPFAFYVGPTLFNSGEITADKSGINNMMIRMTQLNEKKFVYILGNPTTAPNNLEEKSCFVFNKYGDNYVLREIRLGSGEPAYVLPVSPREKELMNVAKVNNIQKQTIEIAAR
jgi:hypothetical protein